MLIYVIIYHKQLVFCFYKDFTKKNFEKLVLNQEIIQDNKSCSLPCWLVFLLMFQAMDHLQSFIADCDRRTEVAKKRLAETQEEISAEVAAKVSM